jgi:signal transduction histidine kinase
VGGLPTATLALYYRQPHAFSDVEIETARALGNLAATALTTAELYQAQRTSEQRAMFLARVSQVLASSLDSDERLRSVAQMAVPRIADWCAIDLLDDAGELQRVAVAHADPAKVEVAVEFARRFPPPRDMPHTVRSTIANGVPTLLPRISDEMLASAAASPEHLAALRSLEIGSLIIVPLRTSSGILGALTLAASDREFTAIDLQFAENVASHVALAVANARTYRRLAAANRTKDEFLAVLSHELRTPLNAVLGYTQMLRTGAVPEDRRESALERVERNATTLAGMVAELLDMSRIVTGQLRVEMRTIELRSVVDDAVATVAPAAQAKGIQIDVEDASPGVVVLADPDRLRQVFWNIMANAVKFTPREGRVWVTLSRTNHSVEICVADTGPGISPDSLARIFEPFLQGDQRPVGEHGGLGLGLAIARHLVEAHGGTIRAASGGPGAGSCFTVRLPAGPSAPE